jgi:hypothetical protein
MPLRLRAYQGKFEEAIKDLEVLVNSAEASKAAEDLLIECRKRHQVKVHEAERKRKEEEERKVCVCACLVFLGLFLRTGCAHICTYTSHNLFSPQDISAKVFQVLF